MKTRKVEQRPAGRARAHKKQAGPKRREEQAPQFRDQLEVVLNGVAEGITVQQPDGKLVYANSAAARLIGFESPEELLQAPLDHVMSRFEMEDEAGNPFPLEQLPGRIALQGRQPSEAVIRFRVKVTGEEHWSIVNAAPIFDEQGRVQLAVNNFRDITERKSAQAAADEQREYLRVTLASIGDAVIATDQGGCVTFMNPVAESYTGWQESEAKGHPLHEIFKIFHEETLEPAPDPYLRVIREGKTVGLGNHTLLETKDGRRIPIEDSAAPIRDAGGAVAGVVLVFRDATERRRAEAAIGGLAAIVASSEEAIIGKDLNAVITFWNKAAERLYGYTAEQAVGNSIAMLVPPERPDELPGIMERLKQGERIEEFETERMTKDGRRIPVQVTISPVRGEKGNIIGASAVAREITKRKLAESEQRFLAAANELLAETLDFESTLERVAQLAVPGFADWCAVHIVKPDGTIEQIALAHKDPEKVEFAYKLQRTYPPRPDAQTGLRNVLRTGRSEMVSEISDEQLIAAAQDEEHLRLIREVGIKSYMVVPLVAHGRSLGAISFISGESDRRFNRQDLELAESLASRAALAIDNARLYKEAQSLNEELERRVVDRTIELVASNRRLEEQIEQRAREQLELQSSYSLLRELTSRVQAVREEERSRIARELHDELGQALTMLRFDVSSLAKHLSVDDKSLRMQAREMSDRIDQTIQSVRRIATELRPGMLDDLGLAAAIEWQAQEFTARTGIECRVSLPKGEVKPDRERATAIFRVFQETLTNITRHAHATLVTVQLESEDGALRLTVHDNGVGFERAKVKAKRSLGLLGMQERAGILGGSFEVESAHGKGTTVNMIVPL